MVLNPRQVWLMNIIASFIFVALLAIFFSDIAVFFFSIPDYLGRPLGNASFSIVNVVVLGLIPIWSYLLTSRSTIRSLRQILLINLATFLAILITCVLAFILCAVFVPTPTVLIPDYFVFVPYPQFFWTIILVIGVVIPHLLRKIIHTKTSINPT